MTKAVTAIVMTVIGNDPSYFFAGEDKRVAGADAHESEHEHCRQPDDQIHLFSLLVRPLRLKLTRIPHV